MSDFFDDVKSLTLDLQMALADQGAASRKQPRASTQGGIRAMSISERFFKKLEQRKNWQEIHYYMVRCEFNATIGGRKPDPKFIQQANRLADLLNAMTLARFRKDFLNLLSEEHQI